MFLKNQNNRNNDRGNIKTLPLLPLRDIIVFPHMVVPLFVGRTKSINAIDEAMRSEKDIMLAAQKNPKTDDPAPDNIYRAGTIGAILQMLRLPDGTVKVLVEGKKRARITDFRYNSEYFLCDVELVEESDEITVETEALMRSVNSTFDTYVKLNKKIPPEILSTVAGITEPSRLADTIVAHLTNLKLTDKQRILEIDNPAKRLEEIFSFMQGEIEILQVERKIRTRVKKQMEKTQKEYYLNEQMRAIQKELGEKDDFKSEIQELEEQLRKKNLTEEADKKVKSELKKFKMMSPMSAEATVVRNYIDWILSLPWEGEVTEDNTDIDRAEQILEEDHYGLKKVKERILEYLAVQMLVKQIRGPILCLVGPPGVGKTSIGKSIARATGRKFVRVSLGGVRDEAEIRGHRRTYIGALPGKIIQMMKKAGTVNPVFLLDEVDKLSSDFRGDPASALLEALDPEQNCAFNDHYLDLDYDLSKVMFVTTANQSLTIPPALLDRMEIIRLPGYTEDEKLEIAMGFLLPKQKENHGLKDMDITFTRNALLTIIREYTREAGVRNLEREIAGVCRKLAKEVVKEGRERKMVINAENIKKYLGVPKYRHCQTEKRDLVGLTNGLAYTEVGGEILMIEVSVVPGQGKLILTGKLGEVMQESAQAAMSYIRSRTDELDIPADFYSKYDFHIHVPEGATPKDGPSAGIALATSIASALTKRPVRHDMAMTGEITLRGRVMAVGGLKEKLLAAHRAEINTVLIPKENEKDLEDVAQHVKKKLNIKLVDHMDEVLREALSPNKVDYPNRLLLEEEEAEPVDDRYEGEQMTDLPAS